MGCVKLGSFFEKEINHNDAKYDILSTSRTNKNYRVIKGQKGITIKNATE